MVSCPPARRRVRATQRPRMIDLLDRPPTAIGAVGDASISYAGSSCAAAAVVAAVGLRHDHRGPHHGDAARHRGADPALLSCRKMDDRHHCRAVAHPPRRGSARARAGRAAPDRAAAAPIEDRSLSALHRQDTRDIPKADGQPPLRHGANAAIPAAPTTSATSSPGIGRGPKRRPICACARCRASRGRSTGVTSAIWKSAARGVR